jgi:hypothetical protein
MALLYLLKHRAGTTPRAQGPSVSPHRNRKSECRPMRAMFFIYAAIIWGGLAAWLIVGLTHG